MIRSLDPAPFNLIANSAEVRPWIGGTGELDLSPLIDNVENYAFLTSASDGGYVVVKLHPGLYMAHTLALPSARGRPMLELMRDGFRYLFTQTDALTINTVCPDGNDLGARWADTAGFREQYRRERCFDLNGESVGASFRALTYDDWVLRDTRNRKFGGEFHDALAKVRPHSHADDPAHDAWVGATLQGCIAGNTGRAIALFNRYAAVSGYVQATVLSEQPPVVNIGDAVVALFDGRLEVLKLIGAEGSHPVQEKDAA